MAVKQRGVKQGPGCQAGGALAEVGVGTEVGRVK